MQLLRIEEVPSEVSHLIGHLQVSNNPRCHQLTRKFRPSIISNLYHGRNAYGIFWIRSKSDFLSLVPITSWQIKGGKVETVTYFIFLGSKITVTMKLRHLLLGRKAIINLDSILKSRDIALLTKVPVGKAMFFPVVIYGCKSQTIKKLSVEEWMLLKTVWRRLVLEKTVWSPLDSWKIKSVNPKGNHS